MNEINCKVKEDILRDEWRERKEEVWNINKKDDEEYEWNDVIK
jgi:hypothetical protein